MRDSSRCANERRCDLRWVSIVSSFGVRRLVAALGFWDGAHRPDSASHPKNPKAARTVRTPNIPKPPRPSHVPLQKALSGPACVQSLFYALAKETAMNSLREMPCVSRKCRKTPWAIMAGLGLAVVWAASAKGADSSSFELIQTIDLKGKAGSLDHMTLDAKHQRLFVANKVNNTLDVVDLKAGKLLRQIRGQSGVQGLAYAPDVDRLFAALGGGGLVNIF